MIRVVTYSSLKKWCIALLMTVICLAAHGRAFNDKDIERFYNLTPDEFVDCSNDYAKRDVIDSAMICANIWANKYGKVELTRDEIAACCCAYRLMGMLYMDEFHNYELATKNLLIAQQIAAEHKFSEQHAVATEDLVIVSAVKNDIMTNFAYSKEVMDKFKQSYGTTKNTIYQPHNQPTEYQFLSINNIIANIVYLAIKYDKTQDVVSEIDDYLNIVKTNNSKYKYNEVNLCQTIKLVNQGEYEKALAFHNLNLPKDPGLSPKNLLAIQQMREIVQYLILMKCKRTKEAEAILLKLEKVCHDNNMTFELLEILNMLQHHYEQQGNDALARRHEFLYYKTKDEFISKSLITKVDQIKLNNELEEARDYINSINYRHKMQTVVLISVITLALLAIGILVILYSKNRQIRKQNEVLYKKNVELVQADTARKQTTSSTPRTTQDEAAQTALLEKIEGVMLTSEEIFDEGFSVNRLAELVNSNRTYVSQVINDRRQCKFNTLLNEYRVKEACRRLLDKENYGNYTIEAIARSVGYKSRANFVSIFKEITGLTPSAFQKMEPK